MNRNFPQNYDPNLFSMVAAIAGAIVSGDFDDYELNSIGNWIILFGQYLLTFAAQQQLIEQRIEGHNININSKKAKQTGNPYEGGTSNLNKKAEIDYLLKAVQRIEKELNDIKKKSNL